MSDKSKTKELAEYITEQLAELDNIRKIPMMGGYIFYYRERIYLRFPVIARRRVKIPVGIMLIRQAELLFRDMNILGAVKSRKVKLPLGLIWVSDIFQAACD